MRFIKSALVVIGVAFIILQTSFSSAQSPAISNGLSYLLSSQTSTGYWGAANEVPYNAFVDTCAVSETLKAIGGADTVYASAIQWVNSIEVYNNDYLLSKLTSLSHAGMDISSGRDYLLSIRNNDGGWGATEGVVSDIKRTALTLQMLKTINYTDFASLYQTVSFLTANQKADGGWGYSSADASNVQTTATVLQALSLYNNVTFNVQGSIDNAVTFLLSKKNTDGGFGSSPSNVYESALALDALIASGANISSIASSAVNYLTTTQLADGSWNENPYSTALALRALASVRPNLAIASSDIALSKAMPQDGATITITANVRNNGYDSASNIVVQFYLGDPSAGGSQIGTGQIIPSLSANSSAQVSIVNSFTGTGGKTIFVVVDPGNSISETTKTDNKASARLWVATGPDLAVYSEDMTPSTYVPVAGTAFTLNYIVRNLGESSTDGFDVALYDGQPSGAPLQTAHISGLAGSEVRTGTFGVTLTGDGSHTLYLVADSGNAITELSETNNTGTVTVTVGGTQTGADLVVTAADITLTPNRPHAGDAVNISAIVRNIGADAAGSFTVEIFDNAPEAGGTLLSSQFISLAANESQTVSTNWTITAGIHDIYVVLDWMNQVIESNENNNRTSTRVMADMVDISISATDLTFTPTHPVANDPVVFSTTVRNTGIKETGAFNVAVYDGDPASGGALLQNFPISNIPGDGSQTLSYIFTAAPHTYRFYVVADTENVVTEMFEDNNLAIRSLKIKGSTETLGPDLVPVKIDLTDTTTDPQTLAVSGKARVTFQNIGDNSIVTPFNVLIFEDKNADGKYTAGVDPNLGAGLVTFNTTTTTNSALWPEGAGIVDIQLSGAVTFLHSPLYAFVDSGDMILEQDETNNVLVFCKDCQVVPTNPIQPVMKWKFLYQGFIYKPVAVAPLIDTNNDGKIDQNDIPAIIFVTSTGYPPFGKLWAIRGDTGQTIFSVYNPATDPIAYYSSVAVGDIDGDGLPEIIVERQGGTTAAYRVYDHQGNMKWDNYNDVLAWNSAHPYNRVSFGDGIPSVADLDGNGVPEIISGATVMNTDGSVRCSRSSVVGTGVGVFGGNWNSSITADLDNDSQQEIIAGNTVYNNDCTVKWTLNSLLDGLTAVGNLDGDAYPEIVLVNMGYQNTDHTYNVRIYLVDHSGNIKWGPVYLSQLEANPQNYYGLGGPPIIADFDGDGKMEIGVKGWDKYFILDKDGNLKHTLSIPYRADLATAPTVFDLNGDGRPEILSNSDGYFRIFDGKTSTQLYSESFGGAGNPQGVIIADIDGDNQAEVVAIGPDAYLRDGIRVYKSDTQHGAAPWVNARKIWNQASYHVTNVNDDGAIPQYEAPSWLLNNTYRTQAAIGANPNPYLTPNLTASMIRATQDSAGINLSVRVGNGGAIASPASVTVTFYDGNPSANVIIGTAATTRTLQTGEYQDLIYSWSNASLGLHHIYAVVDAAKLISECREDDNQASVDITVVTGLPDPAAGAEDITLPSGPYYEGSIIPIMVSVRNLGAVSASNVTARLYNGNPTAGGTQLGLTQTISAISAGGSVSAAFAFDTLGKTGTNVLYIVLDQENSIIEANESNNVALASLNVQPPVLPNLTITTDGIQTAPANPREGEQVIVTATVTNRGASAGNVPVRIAVRSDELGVGSEVNSETKTIYPILGLGQSTSVTATFDTAGLAGQRSILVTIDPANLITESDKTDNSATKPIFIQSAGLTSSVLLDKASYQANDNMTATITASNSTADSRSLFLTLAIKDSAGNLIATISSADAVTLGPNGTVVLNRTWNIGKNLAGNYSVTAEVAEGGVVISRANAGFTITADKSIESKVTIDKISYKPNETATITSTITSQSLNYVMENLTLKVLVALPFTGNGNPSGINPDAAIIYTETRTIATLMPGASFTFKSYWNTSAYAPGTYPVTLTVKDATGAVIATGTQNLVISDVISPKTALRGQVSVDKQSLMAGEPVNVSYTVTNVGNADIPAVTFLIQTVHVVQQTVYDTIVSQASITMGGVQGSIVPIDTANYSAKDYLVVLRANIGGVEETLAGTYFRVEGAPTVPALISPASGSDVDTITPVLTVSNASDPNDDKLTYEFELYGDSGMTGLIASSGDVPSGINPDATAGATSWTVTVSLTENQIYYWRTRAYDGKLYGPWMSPATFRVNMANDPPTAPIPTSPAEAQSVSTLTPVLTVNNASDPDTANLTYNFQVAMDQDFTQIAASTVGVFSGQGTTSWLVTPELAENTWYFWRSQADDWLTTGPWSTTARFFVNTTNEAPTVPAILAPASNAVVASLGADIALANSTDPDSSVISYYVELDTVPTFDSTGIIRSGMVAQGIETTTWHATGLTDNTLYYVRAKASDGEADSAWSSATSFFVNIANDAPTAPVLQNPSIGAGVNVFTSLFSVHNATDLDRDLLTYEFEVYADAGLSSRVSNTSGVNETAGITSWTVAIPLMENQTYWWQARAFDGQATGPWMQTGFFTVNTANDAPGAPALYLPLDGATIATFLPTLSVSNAVDPDSDTLTYDFEVLSAGVLVAARSGVSSQEPGVTSWAVTSALNDNTTYQWRARAYDGDRYGPWTAMAAFTVHVQQVGITVELEVLPETLNQKSTGNWVMVKIELPHGYHASDLDLSSIRLEGVVPAETRPYEQYKHHHDQGCDYDRAAHDHDELKVKFDRSAVIAVLPNGDNVPVHVTGRIGSGTFEGVDFIRVIH